MTPDPLAGLRIDDQTARELSVEVSRRTGKRREDVDLNDLKAVIVEARQALQVRYQK